MASVGWDSVSHYFQIGGTIEICSDDEGFRGSWYIATLIRPPKRNSTKVEVEYSTLKEDEAGTRPLREHVELVNIRPPPPRENGRTFDCDEDVDAYYNDGWWEGVVLKVKKDKDKYKVFFPGTKEKLVFRASDLRLHREWVDGKWEPPLEEPPLEEPPLEAPPLEEPPADINTVTDEETAEKEAKGHYLKPGELVEVCSDEEGLQGAWFAATVIETINQGKYLVEYKNLRNDDNTDFLKEEVDESHVRPYPPDVGLVDRYELHEEVDVLYNDGWWVGVVSKVLKNDRYSVYFRYTDEESKFEHSDLRVHQDWRDGKWHIASKVQNL